LTKKYRQITQYEGQAIATDLNLQPCERETAIYFSDAGEVAQVMTRNAALMRALLRCPFFEFREGELLLPDNKLTYVAGSIPLGALSIKTPRQDDHPSRIVSRSAQLLDQGADCVEETQMVGCK